MAARAVESSAAGLEALDGLGRRKPSVLCHSVRATSVPGAVQWNVKRRASPHGSVPDDGRMSRMTMMSSCKRTFSWAR